MPDWRTHTLEDRQEFLERCAEDREELLLAFDLMYPRFADRQIAEKVQDIILDVCGFHVVDQPLSLGQLALCDFGTKTVFVNSTMDRFVGEKVSLKCLRFSTLAHELGHIRLHAEEIKAGRFVTYEEAGRRHTDARMYQKEKEADFYAAVFLVPKERLLEHKACRSLLEYRLSRRKMASGALWKQIYQIASHFQVTPTLLKNRLVDLGWITARKERGPSQLQKLELRFTE